MAATKVMKFWAVCLAVLGKLLASLGVSAAASAARREAAVYEDGVRDTAPDAAGDTEPDRDRMPLDGHPPFGRRTVGVDAQLPPTIKQRIRAEAHGASPTARTRLATDVEPLHTVPAGAVLDTGTDADKIPATIPAARRRTPARILA
ncbi:DUF6344 domain-containing protein [Streptomyces halobius]|uniref:DUF6344 domain-containing protein n=1 Tax=Streptomyces halobius TaxID=2879846 RepID=A0ABY4MDL9_9ACTN|nr:DUF6344 domain-containing protein [Streptomyces halobius]UQA94406.1 DUF6344 domain-containing protein [Streptomyces halobius]